MILLKYRIFEEIFIETTKTIEDLKFILVELQDIGLDVKVEWTQSNKITIQL